MKRRAFKVLNFFAFNLLFFALYLNFIHKDKNVQDAIRTPHATTANTVMLENTEAKEPKISGGSEKATKTDVKSTAALKLSFN